MSMPDRPFLLFDLDGTLVRLGWGGAEVRALRDEVKRLLTELGLRPPLGEMIPTLADLGRTRPPAARLLTELERAAAAGATACAGAADVLLFCERAGLRCAIVSNNGRPCIAEALRRADLPTAALRAVIGREDVSRYKPDPQPLRRALDQLDAAPPARVFMIGDAPSDIQAARALADEDGFGVTAVGVLSGLGDEPALRNAGARPILQTIDELLPLLPGK